MVDRRRAACRLPMASQWVASDRKRECLAESYSESESLLERPTAEAKVRAKWRRRRPQRRHQATILRRRLETAAGTQGTELAARLSDSDRLDWLP
jgi:hypothetical protein